MPFHAQILSTLKALPLEGILQGLQVTSSRSRFLYPTS